MLTVEIRMGDVIRMRKPHPCGSADWEVVRLGADIGIRCQGCGRRVLIPRREFERSIKSFIRRGDPAAGPPPAHPNSESYSGG
jgi:hypothetical protein